MEVHARAYIHVDALHLRMSVALTISIFLFLHVALIAQKLDQRELVFPAPGVCFDSLHTNQILSVLKIWFPVRRVQRHFQHANVICSPGLPAQRLQQARRAQNIKLQTQYHNSCRPMGKYSDSIHCSGTSIQHFNNNNTINNYQTF